MRKITFLMIAFITITTFGQVKLTDATAEYFNGSEWVENTIESYTYDSSNNLIEIIYSYWDWSNNEWVVGGKDTYTYNISNNLLIERYESFGDDAYSSQTVYTYDSNGRVTEQIEQELEGEVWKNNSKVDVNYINGILTSGDATEWDGTNWVMGDDSALYTFEYDNDDNVSYLMIEEEWNGTTWDSKFRNTYTYDSNGFRITQGSEEWDGTNWVVSDSKQEFENDTTGNRINSKGFSYENGVWEIDRERISIFDTTQLMSNFIHPFVKSELDVLLEGNIYVNKLLSIGESDNNNRTIYHYSDDVPDEDDDRLRLTHSIRESFYDEKWNHNDETVYIYNSNGNLSEAISSSDRIIYTYNANAILATRVQQYSNENYFKSTYSYGSNGEVTQELFEEWDDSAWENSQKNDYTYTNGKLISLDENEWDNDNSVWNLSGTATLTYAADGTTVESVLNESDWVNGAWSSIDRSVHVFNAANKRTFEEDQVQDGGNWVSDGYKSEFTYDSNGNLTIEKDSSLKGEDWKVEEQNYTYDISKLLSGYLNPFAINNIDILFGKDPYENKLLTVEYSGLDRTIYHYSDDDDTASVSGFNLVDVSVYPNPTTDFITVSGGVSVKNIEIFTIVGKKVKTTDKTSFSIKEFANGIYILKVNTTDGKTGVSQIIKK